MKSPKNQQEKIQAKNAFHTSEDPAKNAAQERFIHEQVPASKHQQQKNLIFPRYSFDDNGGGYLGL